MISIDQSPAMLEVRRRKFALCQTVDYRLGQADHLPLPDQAVDCAFANMYLHHMDHPARAIEEMARILRPGGTLVITDLDEHAFAFLREEHHDRWMGFKREDVRRWMTGAGLASVTVDSVSETCCAQSRCGSEQASVGIFLASGRK